MSFVCDQDWNQMKPTVNGRYCDICKKNVFDFTNKTKGEVKKLDKGVCGIFLPEHVEDGLTPINFRIFSKIKNYAATFATMIGLGVQSYSAQTPNQQKPQIEAFSGDTISEKPEPLSETTVQEVHSDDCLPKDDPLSDKKSFMHLGRRNFYWLNKFPFIASRKHRMGAKF